MRSAVNDKRRHKKATYYRNVVGCTTHEIGHGKKAPWYPEGMAKDFEELGLWWEDEQLGGSMDENAKRLLLFAQTHESGIEYLQNGHRSSMCKRSVKALVN